jgi:hypothetical protein
MKYKKTFKIVHKTNNDDDGDGKESTLIVRFCCETFYNYFNIEKIKFDEQDRHGNEYPYLELLNLEDDAAIPDDAVNEPRLQNKLKK